MPTGGPAERITERIASWVTGDDENAGDRTIVATGSNYGLGRDCPSFGINGPGMVDLTGLARFEREARTLAALNHAHIAHIHGLATADRLRIA